MAGLLWRIVEWRLWRLLPPAHRSSTVGDLAEDYAIHRAANGRVRAALWLLREAWSLARAYRAARVIVPRGRVMFGSELGCALRRMRARPTTAIASAGLLAVGVGLCTATFSLVDAILLRPAPFRDADRLVRHGFGRYETQLVDAWRTSGLFEAVEVGRVTPVRVAGGADGVTWPGATVTPGVFELLGVAPFRGRTFTAASPSASPDEILLSETIWRSYFASDPTLIGRRITLDGGSPVVVGIMPASFRFPEPVTVAWTPLRAAPLERGLFTLFGRLKADVPFSGLVEGRLRVLGREFANLPRNQSVPPVRRVGVPSLDDFTTRALWFLLAGSTFVFLVLTANVSGLVLASLSARQREYGVCTALGAPRARLMREALIEHTLVGVAGATLGVWLAWGLTTLVPDVFSGHTLNPIDLDLRALIASWALATAAVLLSGLVPAWLGTRTDAVESMRRRSAGPDPRRTRLAGNGLLVAEVALACTLLTGSALLVRSFVNLVRADRGINSEGILRVDVGGLDDAFVSIADAATLSEKQTTYRRGMSLALDAIETRFRGWPEIASVALSREIPPGPTRGVSAHLGAPGAPPDVRSSISVDSYRVSAEFLDMYGIRLRRGRVFQPGDTLQDVIVSERLAERLWPGQDPVGRSFSVDSSKDVRRVIGVAREIRLPSLDAALDVPEMYSPLGNESRTLHLNIRCRAACPNQAAFEAQVRTIHPGLRARIVNAAEDVFLSELRLPRALAEVAGVFTAVAMLASAAGLFSVLTCAIVRRRREFGIRTAIGASPRQIRGLVVREGLSVVAGGVVLGTLGGALVARGLSAFSYGVTSADPVTWSVVLGTVVLTALAATWHPARQASRTDPVGLLRHE
jgi:putative ABC transport system permease protein